jgi:hypothetical protein
MTTTRERVADIAKKYKEKCIKQLTKKTVIKKPPKWVHYDFSGGVEAFHVTYYKMPKKYHKYRVTIEEMK